MKITALGFQNLIIFKLESEGKYQSIWSLDIHVWYGHVLLIFIDFP